MNIYLKLDYFAKELGFTELVIAPAESLEEEVEILKRWNDKGYNASMKWLEKNYDKRADLQKVLPDVKSIIVLAHNYYHNSKENYPQNIREFGKISIHAQGYDYHTVIKEKLLKVGAYLSELICPVQYRSYVDTGP
ncbi:MAG: epoxyqueuosine reductase, partial [Bacteroidota bacterium]|nr:epoxyqueuosine reductase [Bacteroidota bacterium]